MYVSGTYVPEDEALFATDHHCYHYCDSDGHHKKGNDTCYYSRNDASGQVCWLSYSTAFRLHGVNHHRTSGVHLQLCRGHYNVRGGGDPGGEEGGHVH